IRNSVGFAWHPQTKKLWFSDNGRDMLGDDIPADEINRIDESGQHFGFPYCHGGDVVDPKFNQKPCRSFSPPAKQLGAHVAPLGIAFYTGDHFPKAYTNQLFVAEHGSWNRSKKVGYRVALARLSNEKIVSYETFVSGWLEDEKAWGRPAYLLVMPDGSLLISDDKAGAIYRVSFQERHYQEAE
ncbi:MAG: PQQ-dependent sugar dehydrogenase, partial [Thiotrichaceae bacterium]